MAEVAGRGVRRRRDYIRPFGLAGDDRLAGDGFVGVAGQRYGTLAQPMV